MKLKRSTRFIATIILVRATRTLMKLFHLKATHFPGQLAKKLCPDFLSRIEKPDQIIAVTGTNGKTTVANLIADLGRQFNLSFAHNAYGSNIEEGVITALLDATTLTGRKKLPLAVLEIDERLTRIVFKSIQPDYLIVTNLFRESYLRNAHGEFVFDILDANIPLTTHLITNADDLLSQGLARKRPHTSFGIARLPGEATVTHSLIRDVVLCPICHAPVTDLFIRYHHIGRSHCTACGWQSMTPDYEITKIMAVGSVDQPPLSADKIMEADAFVLTQNSAPGAEEIYPFRGENILDLYNELTAVTLFRTLGYSSENVAEALSEVKIGKSRKQVIQVGDKKIYRMLAKGKNPIAVSRVLEAITKIPGPKQFVFLFDTSTGKMDGEDNTAWLYDADLSILRDHDVKRIVVGGYRAKDIKVALLFAGVSKEKIVICKDKRKTAREILPIHGQETIAILYELYSDPVSKKVAAALRASMIKQNR
ncbi:MAG: DUF1727 domain-containing protein [Clostridiaceae bacterium]|nr:DUF1727 domain-containing protein [Clostridiaceae bacterium]